MHLLTSLNLTSYILRFKQSRDRRRFAANGNKMVLLHKYNISRRSIGGADQLDYRLLTHILILNNVSL